MFSEIFLSIAAVALNIQSINKLTGIINLVQHVQSIFTNTLILFIIVIAPLSQIALDKA